MRRSTQTVFGAALFLFAAARFGSAVAAEPPAWQKHTAGVDPAKQELGGLGFLLRLDEKEGWPRPGKEVQFDHGRHFDEWTFPHASRLFSPVDLGMIEPADGTDPAPDEAVKDWSGWRVSLIYSRAKGKLALNPKAEPEMKLVASRLFPGLLVKADSDGLILFSGFKHIGRQIGDTTKVEIEKGSPWRKPAGYSMPAYAAVRTPAGAEVRHTDMLEELPTADLEKNWLLVWYGKESFFKAVRQANGDINLGWGEGKGRWEQIAYQADCPFLILPGGAVDGMSKDVDAMGLRLEFLDDSCAVLIVPLMGEALPPVAETAKWEKELPADVIALCDWWAAHVRKLPVAAAETCAYGAESDELVITESFDWVPFRESGEAAAPVPPFMATAFLEQFPMRFSAPPFNPRIVTPAGSWLAVPGAESYSVTLKGMGKYVFARKPPSDLAKAPARLREALAAEVRKIVEAGHLAPWMRPKKNIWNAQYGTAHLIHSLPGETLAALAEALPLLEDADLKEKVLAYMKQEREAFPPEKNLPLQGGHGARRESYDMPEFFLLDIEKVTRNAALVNINAFYPDNFYVARRLVPPQALYHLAAFYTAAGEKAELDEARWRDIRSVLEPYLLRLDWALGCVPAWADNIKIGRYTAGPFRALADRWYGCGGVVDVNNFFAAAVGLLRLAALKQDAATEREAWGLLGRAALTRFAFGKMCGHLYRVGLYELPPYWDLPAEDLREPYFADECGMSLMFKTQRFDGGLTMARDMTPELALFMRDHLRPETERYFTEYAFQIPHWHLAWCEAAVDYECNVPWPQDGFQTFMANALVLDRSAAWLEAHFDLPWQPRGDLFYIHKLVETIRRHAGE